MSFTACFLLPILALACLAAPPSESAGFSKERLARVDKGLEGYVVRNEIAGAVGLIARRGRIAAVCPAGC